MCILPNSFQKNTEKNDSGCFRTESVYGLRISGRGVDVVLGYKLRSKIEGPSFCGSLYDELHYMTYTGFSALRYNKSPVWLMLTTDPIKSSNLVSKYC